MGEWIKADRMFTTTVINMDITRKLRLCETEDDSTNAKKAKFIARHEQCLNGKKHLSDATEWISCKCQRWFHSSWASLHCTLERLYCKNIGITCLPDMRSQFSISEM